MNQRVLSPRMLMFQHTAARRRLAANRPKPKLRKSFNTQPPEGGWFAASAVCVLYGLFQHTAARRRLDTEFVVQYSELLVSTHSRPKAAGCYIFCHVAHFACFNTQPPEGGWRLTLNNQKEKTMFQHTAARRRLVEIQKRYESGLFVSTHSRPKAAGTHPMSFLGRP